MPFWTNACKYGQIANPVSAASLCSSLINAHLAAGWTTVSGDLSDMTIRSVATPTLGLQMDVRIYSPSASYVYYRPIQPFTTSNPDQMRLAYNSAWTYIYSISPHQSIFWKKWWEGNYNEQMGGFGCPWFPTDMSSFITSMAWVMRSDSGAFRSEGDAFYVEAKLNALTQATEWFNIERYNPNGTNHGRFALVGLDDGHTFFDPIIACTNLGLGGARLVGGLWDAVISRQQGALSGLPNQRQFGHREVFDGKSVEKITRVGTANGWFMWVRGGTDA